MVQRNRIFGEIDLQNAVTAVEDPITYYDETLLGQLCFNRVSSIAYYRAKQSVSCLKKMPSEYIKTLDSIHQVNLKRTEEFMESLVHLSVLFKDVDFKHAFLKGAFLTPKMYPSGLRTSNDIDILVQQNDISKCQDILARNGFIQGHLEANELVPSTRQQIINSRMNFGETIPFRKKINDRYMSVDINFSLDFKPSGDTDTIIELLDASQTVEIAEKHFLSTLAPAHFLIHLCCHLYKEATTYHWVRYRRDLMLYKFSDICVFLDSLASERFFADLTQRILELDVGRECYYAFENTCIIFPRLRALPSFEAMIASIRPSDLHFMRQVVWPAEKRRFRHTMNFDDWFFCTDRIGSLEEI